MPVKIDNHGPELPNLNNPVPTPPQRNPETYHNQNVDAISGAIELRTQEVSQSLRRLDSQLASFERRFAKAATDRIDQIPLRIERQIASILQEREVARSGFNLSEAISAVEVPCFELPPAIMPTTAMGCLPI